MIKEDILAKEFVRLVLQYYPSVGELLNDTYVKVITNYWGKPRKRFQYVGIYCCQEILPFIRSKKDALEDIAQNMGLSPVVILNSSRLLKDPKSKLKQADPRLWFDLQLLEA